MDMDHAARAEGTSPPKMAWLSLRFEDEDTERRYVDEHLRRSLPIIRLSLLFGVVLYAAFGILDTYILKETLSEVWTIRFGFVCPGLLVILLLTYTPYFLRVPQLFLSLAMAFSGLGIVAMTAVADAPGNSLYYGGLVMVVIYCSSLIRLRFMYATAIALGLFALYQYVAVYVNPIPDWALISNSFFLAMSISVGIFSSYAQEYFIRHSFANNQLLRAEKLRSEALLADAEAANHAKSDFLAVMSHELRTPLNAIIGFSEVMKHQMFGPLGSDQYRSYAEDIHHSGNHLLSIIGDILDLSKAEAGTLTLHEEDVDLRDLLDQCLRMFREKAAAEGIELRSEIPEITPWLRGDPRLLRQALLNLLSNAVKFTEAGGSVTAAVEWADDGACLIRVRDTGVGIAAENLEKVLEPFVQVESVMTRIHEGAGLGLPLVKKIMELHGGRLEIASEPGVGTTLTARIPPERIVATREREFRRAEAG